MSIRRFLLLASFLGLCYSQDCSYNNLVQFLKLDSQSKDVRPVLKWKDITNVTITMYLYTIVKLDNHMQLLTSYVWFAMTWKNEFINWDPEAFCNIEFFFYSSDNLWTPDNYILEMTEADSKNPVTPFYQISYDGFISAAKPIRIVSSCNLNIFYYPFDTQTCNITFGPYISDDVNFISEVNSSYLYEQTQKVFFSIGEWNLINLNVSDIGNRAQYQITIKRNSSVQVIAFIVPICFLVILDIIGMFIHLRDTERLMFKITVVLGFAFLLVVLNQILSTSESPPLLMSYFERE
ncbi:5-hydroxytryptamine receptor 3A-like [Ranitomeya imitator]|uniref:5-hydroxytryptamine receptor 3A-like n=1 Tax=Ranitomeya imitator TaxID=111125 RepID=UPI0037E7A1B2